MYAATNTFPTFSSTRTDAASVVVHVINGEHPAAMQHGNNSANRLSGALNGFLHRITRRALTTLAASLTKVTTTTKCPREHPLVTGELQRQTVSPVALFWRWLQQLLLAAATTNWRIVSVGWLLSKWALQCGQWQHRQARLQRQRPLENHCRCWWHWRRWSASAALLR